VSNFANSTVNKDGRSVNATEHRKLLPAALKKRGHSSTSAYAKKYYILIAEYTRSVLEFFAKPGSCILRQKRPEKELDGRALGCVGTVHTESAWLSRRPKTLGTLGR
jgi:hypothetical protein